MKPFFLLILFIPLVTVWVVTITQKGYFQVNCNTGYYSQHSTYRKALESAINQIGVCTITAPNTEVDTRDDSITTVNLQWSHPSKRVDGSSLPKDQIKKYIIHYANKPDEVGKHYNVEVDSDLNFYTIDLPNETWYLTISTVDISNLEGPMSEMISINL